MICSIYIHSWLIVENGICAERYIYVSGIYKAFYITDCSVSGHNLYQQAPSICTHVQRKGTFCGECDYSNGSFPYVYYYSALLLTACGCIYITVALLPLTVYIAFIPVFKISAASPELHAFVPFAQIIAALIQLFYSSDYVLLP